MNDMDLTRRKVLSGLTAAGGAGALMSGGTAALFSDTESFSDNSLDATAGVVDIDVTIDGSSTSTLDISSTGDGGQSQITVAVPETVDGGQNNPVRVWMGAECLEPSEVVEDLDVTLRHESGRRIVDNDLEGLVDALQIGTRLDPPDDDTCVDPGDSLDLLFEWEPVDDSDGFTSSVTFKFVATQCRYDVASSSPFLAGPDECPEPGESTDTAISFIAFCAGDVDASTLDPTVEITSYDDDGDGPMSVDWQTDDAIETVIVKTGNGSNTSGSYQACWEYTYDGGATSGTVASGGAGGGEGISCEPSEPCENGSVKLEYDDSDGFETETEETEDGEDD